MKNTVILKGNKYGISIVLDETADFSVILSDLENKLEYAENFFDSDKQLAVSFEGRILTNAELDQILCVIKENSKLNIQYVMEENSDLETTFFDIIQTAKEEAEESEQLQDSSDVSTDTHNSEDTFQRYNITDSLSENMGDNNGMFYRGTLRSGQTLEAKGSLVIIGDVNPGAKIIAEGNIVILGTLKGRAYAGCKGDTDAFVLALSMDPIEIQIADMLYKNTDRKKSYKTRKEPMIATIVNDRIHFEPVTKKVFSEIY